MCITQKSIKKIMEIMNDLENNGKEHDFLNVKVCIHGGDNICHMSNKQIEEIEEIARNFYFDEWNAGTPGELDFLIDDNHHIQFAYRIDYHIIWSCDYEIQDSDIEISLVIFSSGKSDDLRVVDFEERDYNYND